MRGSTLAGTRVICMDAAGTGLYGEGTYLGDVPQPGWNHPEMITMCEKVIIRSNSRPPIINARDYYAKKVTAGDLTQQQADVKIAIQEAYQEAERARPVTDRAWQLAASSGCNPVIRLDDGPLVWGCMCWWTTVDDAPASRLAQLRRLPKVAAPQLPDPPRPTSLAALIAHPAMAHLHASYCATRPLSQVLMSPCGGYRYALTRGWDGYDKKPVAVFLMLNPSTADAVNDDATIRRCIRFADREGCGGLVVVNAYALRATDPKELAEHHDPAGPDNLKVLLCVLAAAAQPGSGPVIAAWGADPQLPRSGQLRLLRQAIQDTGVTLSCLGTNAAGSPRHPVRLHHDTPLIPYTIPIPRQEH